MAPRAPRRPPSRSRAPGKGQATIPGLEYEPGFPRPPAVVRSLGFEMPKQDRGQAQGIPARTAAARRADLASIEALEAALSGDDSLLLPYRPTPSINPPRPRTRAAGYDPTTRTLRVRFRDGAVYGYYDVPPNVWRNFKRVKSPGRAINRTLNGYAYAREEI
jgi:KTSC domain